MTDSPVPRLHTPEIISRSEHNVSRAGISKPALKVLYRLKDAGYAAFIVGGGVRDLLLGLTPKDFDIATDARPEDVRALFGNSRLIGRRFRLVHVRFGREIIEVATFRGAGDGDGDEGRVLHESGRILTDNAYGSIEEDARRRDFTINALFYNIADFSIVDYVGGMADIRARRLRLIGDPETRYREDPVRMLRAARLAAKLDLDIHPDTGAPIPQLAGLIDAVPPARLFDEFLKLFQTGHAVASCRLLRELGLFEHLFPQTAAALADDPEDRFERLIAAALRNTDARVAEGKPVTPMFLFGVLLWEPTLRRAVEIAEAEGGTLNHALIAASAEVTAEQAQRIALPRRYSFPMREVLQLQPRFENRVGRRAKHLIEHRRFRAAYDLLVLRGEVGEVDEELVEFWTGLQELPDEQRHETLDEAQARPRSRRRRRPRRARRAAPAH